MDLLEFYATVGVEEQVGACQVLRLFISGSLTLIDFVIDDNNIKLLIARTNYRRRLLKDADQHFYEVNKCPTLRLTPFPTCPDVFQRSPSPTTPPPIE